MCYTILKFSYIIHTLKSSSRAFKEHEINTEEIYLGGTDECENDVTLFRIYITLFSAYNDKIATETEKYDLGPFYYLKS